MSISHGSSVGPAQKEKRKVGVAVRRANRANTQKAGDQKEKKEYEAAQRAKKNEKTQAEMEQFLAEFKENNPDASPEEAGKALLNFL